MSAPFSNVVPLFEHALEGLGWREFQVLEAASRGRSAKETARELGLATETVKTYRRQALAVLHARNMAEAVHKAHLAGVLPSPPGMVAETEDLW